MFKQTTLFLLLLLPVLTKAQRALEPYIGYGIDVNNKPFLSQVSIGLQYPLINKPVYQMLAGVAGGFPINKNTGNDQAFASDPAYALNTDIGYETKLYSAMLYIHNSLKVVSWGKNTFSGFVLAGVGRQGIRVNHEAYDQDKYTILNPQRSFKAANVLMGGGLHYKYRLNAGYLFVQPETSCVLFVKKSELYRFRQPVILSVNLGYGIEFKKREK